MDEEALGRGRPFPVAVGERLERPRALVARLADGGEEERLLDPRLRVREQVRARDEHRVVGGRAGRQVGRAREEGRRPVLHRAEDAAVVVAVHRPPRSPLLLGALDPLPLLGLAVPTALPPHARLADRGRGLERRAGEAGEPGGHCFAGGAPTRSTTTSTEPTLHVRHALDVLRDALLHLPRDAVRGSAPRELDVDVDLDRAVGARDLGGVAREAGDALHLERRIPRVAREHVVGDDRSFHYFDRTTSSVTSGLAKRRNGTNVVPSPGETCSLVDPYS